MTTPRLRSVQYLIVGATTIKQIGNYDCGAVLVKAEHVHVDDTMNDA